MLKSTKEKPVCSSCLKAITGKVQESGSKLYCFRCYVPVRQQIKWLEDHKKDTEVEEKIRSKRWYCPSCKRMRSDTDFIHCSGWVRCYCGRRMSLKARDIILKIHEKSIPIVEDLPDMQKEVQNNEVPKV